MTNFENYLSKVIYMELKTLKGSGALDFSNYQHPIKKIYIDMDGVLVDFENGIKNIIPTFGKLTKSLDSNEMWKAVEKKKNFWETLKPLPNAKELIALLKRKFKSAEFYILTGVPSDQKKISKELEEKDKEIGFINSASKDGKKKWIEKNFPEFNNKIIFVRRIQKQEYSQEGCLLIDDNLETCEEWNIKEGVGIWYNHKNKNFNAIKKTIKSLSLGIWHTKDKKLNDIKKFLSLKKLKQADENKVSQKTFDAGYHDISLDVSKNNSKYIGVVLDSNSKRSIKTYIKKYIKTLGLKLQKWQISGDHITIARNKKELSESGIDSESIKPLKYSGKLDAIGYLPNKENPELIAFRVEKVETEDNRTIKFENKQKAKVKANVAHVTFGYTGEQEPKNSGSITVWDKLIEPINISGTLMEV